MAEVERAAVDRPAGGHLFEAVFRDHDAVMLLVDPADGQIVDANPSAAAFYGYPVEELRSMSITQINTLPPDEVAAHLAQARVRELGHFVFPHRLASGEIRRVDVHASPIRDGRRLLFSIIVDVEDELRAVEALADSERRYRLLAENSTDMVSLIDPDGVFLWVSPGVRLVLGCEPSDLVGTKSTDLVHPDDLNAACATMPLGSSPPVEAQVRFRRRDGQYRWMAATSRPVTDPDGVVTGRIDTIRDIHNEVLARQRLAAAEEESRLAFDRSSVATCLVSNDGRIIRVNPAICDLLGRSAADLLTLTFLDVTHPDDVSVGADLLRDLLVGRRTSLRLTKRYLTGDGGVVWGDVTVSAVLDAHGAVRHRIAQILDVTGRVLAERALAASEEMLRAVLDASRDPTMRMSPDLRVEYVNRRMVEESGRPFEEWIGRNHTELGYPVDLVRLWEGYNRQVFATGEPLTYEFEIDNAGRRQWFETSLAPEFDRDGSVAHVVATSREVTDRKEAAEALRVLATRDPLTGLANRAELLDEISRAVSAGQRSGRSTAVLMMDLDRFKGVNDTLGHAAGDDLLVAAAARIATVVRAGDLMARPGGDEFVVVMRDLDDPTDAVRAARRLVEEFRAPFTHAGPELYATASIGVAIAASTAPPAGAGDLLREADTAMYAAKEAGRDRVSVFNEELRAAATARLALESDLRQALARGQLAVWYQPEVDLTTGAVTAVEALLRWHHPDGSVWTADRFVDVAEDTGLILDIGDWVLRQASAQAAAWAAARPDRPITMRVNASALQLAETGLLPAIDDALASSGLDPTLLCIEITETALLCQTAIADSNLDGIHRRRIGIAIDDFGTGYASLTYLSRYPIDVLKIDRSFLTDPTAPDHDHRLVAGIIALAHGLGIKVTAEGVEHPDQATHLRAMGCPTAQGFLYSPPLPGDQITPLLDQSHC